MYISVYSDASTRLHKGYSSVAFVVLKGNKCLKSYSKIIHTDNVSRAESVAVNLALEYVINNISVSENDTIVFYSDSRYAVKFSRKRLSDCKNNTAYCAIPVNEPYLLSLYRNIPRIKCKVKFAKISAHQSGKNPHSFADRLARASLGMYDKERM